MLLKGRLDNVAAIIDRTLTTIDRNPQVLERLLQGVDKAVGAVVGVANTALGPGGAVTNTLNNVSQIKLQVIQKNHLKLFRIFLTFLNQAIYATREGSVRVSVGLAA